MRARALWELRERARSHDLAPGRLRRCGRINYKKEVELVHAQGACWWDGVVRCRARVCPVCWVTRRVRNAQEVMWVSEQWYAETGVQQYLVTFTVRHHSGEPAELARRVRACWRKALQRRQWKSLMKQLDAQWIVAEEVTHGGNGWHPHLHMLLLPSTELAYAEFETQLTAAEKNSHHYKNKLKVQNRAHCELLAAELFDLWSDIVVKEMGSQYEPSQEHGTDLRPCSAAEYLTKIGYELADPSAVKGRSPLQLLAQGQLDLYMQLQDARRRARDITYSRGLKAIREEMPSEGVLCEKLMSLSGLQWGYLATRADGLAPLQVLESAAEGPDAARAAVRRFLGPLAGP